MQKVPFCNGLVGIEAVVETRLSRIAGSGKCGEFPDGWFGSAGFSRRVFFNELNAD